jgi:pyruvate-formate lyase-activating enzyme
MTLPVQPSQSRPRLMRRRTPPTLPVTPRSIALFRLGEACNNHCPMCSNSGRPEAWLTPQDELLRRVDWLASQGMKRVVVTGGEPTSHPAFWPVIAHLGARAMTWDINSNGRTFAQIGFADRAVEEGLQRAIISLHSHVPNVSQEISGVTAKGHKEIIAGIDALVAAGVPVMLNLVLTKLNHKHLLDYLRWTVDRWGHEIELKVCFPTTVGRGGGWDGIDMRYSDVQAEVRAFVTECDAINLTWHLESFPPCAIDDPRARNMSRSGFGETHYLDDLSGDRLYPIAHIEAELGCFAESCRSCQAFDTCPGVSEAYARRFGTAEFTPFR